VNTLLHSVSGNVVVIKFTTVCIFPVRASFCNLSLRDTLVDDLSFGSQGKVHNPSGEGVRAVSSQVQNRTAKIKSKAVTPADDNHNETHETKVKEIGSARRNITRKKSGANEGTYDSRNKKQGGHGKGKWDELMDGSMDEYVEPLNEKDPLYDEVEQDGRYVLSGGGGGDSIGDPTGQYDENTHKAIYGPMLTLPEFKIRLAESIREYFDSADSDEVIRSIEELKCRSYHPEVVKKAVSLSLDEGPRERELISRLLTCLHPTPLNEEDLEAGFELLLNSLDDLSIDIPDAKVRRVGFVVWSENWMELVNSRLQSCLPVKVYRGILFGARCGG